LEKEGCGSSEFGFFERLLRILMGFEAHTARRKQRKEPEKEVI
jgi:hypothetical protein